MTDFPLASGAENERASEAAQLGAVGKPVGAAAFVDAILRRAPWLRHRILLLGAAAILCLWLAVFYVIEHQRTRAILDARRDTANLALAFDEQLARTLKGIDQGLLALKRQFERDPAHFSLTEAMHDDPVFEDVAFQVTLADAEGWLRDTSIGALPGPWNISDRVHFLVHVERDTGQPFISVPVRLRASGRLAMQMTRRLNRLDGSFAGIIAVSIDPSYLARFYQAIDIGKYGIVTIVGADGIVRARSGRSDADSAVGLGRSLLDAPLFTQGKPIGSFQTQSRFDRIERIYAYPRSSRYPPL